MTKSKALFVDSPIGRQETGALIPGIIRGTDTINNPAANERIYCGDRIVLSGTKEQLRKAIEMLSQGHL